MSVGSQPKNAQGVALRLSGNVKRVFPLSDHCVVDKHCTHGS
jgi:hypothetical protein